MLIHEVSMIRVVGVWLICISTGPAYVSLILNFASFYEAAGAICMK
jgi:hypothetical protein